MRCLREATIAWPLACLVLLGTLAVVDPVSAQEPRVKAIPKEPDPVTVEPWFSIDEETARWKAHLPNPRFQVYGEETEETRDDLVLDRETGLIWLRDLNRGIGYPEVGMQFTFPDANRRALDLARQRRKGFRLPQLDELASLIYLEPGSRDRLPSGHPFIGIKTGEADWYWSSTPDPVDEGKYYCVNFATGRIEAKAIHDSKGKYTGPVYHYHWPVRIGKGLAASLE